MAITVPHRRRRRCRHHPSRRRARGRRRRAAGYDGTIVPETQHDPFVALALAARATERITLTSGIAVAFARNPMTTAMAANDIQTISQGRFVLGLGSQVKAHIERRFSMPWSHPAARMQEYVEAVRAIWHAWADRRAPEVHGRVLHATR